MKSEMKTESDVREWIESINEQCPPDDFDAELATAWQIIFGRQPDPGDEARDAWSHLCAGVSHE